MVGLVHALGHSVEARCQVHHGTCMGILLPHVLHYNLEARVHREDLEATAKLSLDDGSLIYNAAEAGFDDALRLLQRAFRIRRSCMRAAS